jgi:hypothetical protein
MARDWHRGPTASLAALSFDLHQQLSDEHNGETLWGYRRVTTLQVNINASKRNKKVPGVDWIDGASSSQFVYSPSQLKGHFGRTYEILSYILGQ